MERGGRIADRYELVKRLGSGGMGEVWAGRDHDLHRDVALKLLILNQATHPDLPKRFEREAVAAAQINHPNVAALYERGVQGNVLYIVLEKVEGSSLGDVILHEGRLDPARALAIAGGICAALVAAHRAGVVHYDIKPHNVMLTADGQVKVVDFGIAGFNQTPLPLARTTVLAPAGTAEYAAPEQFLAERGDERSDLYALGGVLFAMLTGQPPFTGDGFMEVLQRKLAEDAPRPDTIRTGLPPALASLVTELLDRAPARRPQTAQQVQTCLSRLQAGAEAPEALEVHPRIPDAGPGGTDTISPGGLQPPLVQALASVSGPQEFGAQLRVLRQRADGTWTEPRMAHAVFSSEWPIDPANQARADTIVERWFNGESLPARWAALERLVTALGARDDEVSAVRVAWIRIISSHPDVPLTPDGSLGPTEPRATQREPQPPSRPRGRIWRWLR
ncbi:serine/threonine protein kinase [Streptomyces sp. NBC_01003]|uniref:serine/threonine-protein kinase n=1 Tax=Streptomyces sp. NBC_01003 TaxID=2903714 RepID=UPI00386BF1E8|nr:serine/threonine protein kinase [Streptomyces sp. NBC_01003]